MTGGAADAELGELLQASLVQGQAGDARSELFELVRAFGLQELDAAQRLQETRTRHLRYFTALAQSASEAYQAGVAFAETAARLREDHANLRAAFDHAIATGAQEAAATIPPESLLHPCGGGAESVVRRGVRQSRPEQAEVVPANR